MTCPLLWCNSPVVLRLPRWKVGNKITKTNPGSQRVREDIPKNKHETRIGPIYKKVRRSLSENERKSTESISVLEQPKPSLCSRRSFTRVPHQKWCSSCFFSLFPTPQKQWLWKFSHPHVRMVLLILSSDNKLSDSKYPNDAVYLSEDPSTFQVCLGRLSDSASMLCSITGKGKKTAGLLQS